MRRDRKPAAHRARKGQVAPLPEYGEPSLDWVASTLGVSLEDADWLLILYRFEVLHERVWGAAASARQRYYCEALEAQP